MHDVEQVRKIAQKLHSDHCDPECTRPAEGVWVDAAVRRLQLEDALSRAGSTHAALGDLDVLRESSSAPSAPRRGRTKGSK